MESESCSIIHARNNQNHHFVVCLFPLFGAAIALMLSQSFYLGDTSVAFDNPQKGSVT